MTKEKAYTIAIDTFEKCREWGFNEDEQIAKAIINRVMKAIEEELEAASMGVLERPRKDTPRPNLDNRDRLKPPSPTEGNPSLITPESPEWNKVAAPVLRLPIRPADPVAPDKPFWDLATLQEHIVKATPEVIVVKPNGREAPVSLRRNVEMQMGIDSVRLAYSLGVENQPMPSSGGNRQGDDLPAISIDTPVFQMFSCFDRTQPIEARMREIYRTAEVVYAPRPEHVESRTPIIIGKALSFTSADPNDNV